MRRRSTHRPADPFRFFLFRPGRTACWSFPCGLLVAALSLLCAAEGAGQASEAEESAGAELSESSATSAHWIWSSDKREAGRQVLLRRCVTLSSVPRAARWISVADFCRARFYVNGRLIADVEPFEDRLQLDVAPYLRRGANVLAVDCRAVGGPAAVFAHLEWTAGEETRRQVVSDGSWKVSERVVEGWLEPDYDDSRWQPARSLGRVARQPWGTLADPVRISPLDDYTQWKRALDESGDANPTTFLTLPGFTVQRLRSAAADEGSWVSMAFDPQGRPVLAREDRGLLRLTLPPDASGAITVETIDDSLQECRGLLFAHGSLYANANNSKALYRLRDTTGDDRFDEVKRLLETTGGVGHGRNDLALGPDGFIYSIHGDSVDIPRDVRDLTSPFREHRRGGQTREGHVLRLDRDGGQVEVVAAGLRNPFGIDFNGDGEMFTYDADAEFDMGAPWYRPTRVDHMTAGADFGWRGVTGSWPPYFPDHADNAPPALDIGKGSPTAVMFGTGSRFPPPYRRALFILDWAYGRILAIHMTPRGSGYACRAETFLRGRPLNVTDLAFGPDGAMYFITGGRKTQSALYRVEYTGPPVGSPAVTLQQEARTSHGHEARRARRQLESLFAAGGAPDGKSPIAAAAARDVLDAAWPSLDDPDPRLRYAARIAVEHQPVELWFERALEEHRATAGVTALLAAARSGPDNAGRQRIVERLNELPLAEYTQFQQLAALHVYRLCLLEEEMNWTALDPTLREATLRQLHALYPHRTFLVNRAASRLLAELDGPAAIAPTMKLLRAAEDPTERLHYLFVLRTVRAGWTPEQRREYFVRLRAAGDIVGGQGMPGFLSQVRDEALATLEDTERETMLALLKSGLDDEKPLAEFAQRPLVRKWTVEELARHLELVGKGRSYERGRRLYREALCSRCHRLGDQGTPVGPDLTAVGNRFSLRDLLVSIVKPSEVIAENYRNTRIITASGKVFTGRARPARDYRDPALELIPDLLRPGQVVSITKSDIELSQWSPVSPMPEGLLDRLELEEILELLAYVQSGGNPRHPIFAAPPADARP